MLSDRIKFDCKCPSCEYRAPFIDVIVHLHRVHYWHSEDILDWIDAMEVERNAD